MIVVLDPGHGGVQPGAVYNDLMEKDVTLALCIWARSFLIADHYKVNLTRASDKNVRLDERVNVPGDIFVSVHCNAGGGQGLETWHQVAGPYASASEMLARYVHAAILRAVPFKDRGLKTKLLGTSDFFYVLRQNKRPAILIECGFIDNPQDAALLQRGNIRMLIGKAIAQGIKDYAAAKGI